MNAPATPLLIRPSSPKLTGKVSAIKKWASQGRGFSPPVTAENLRLLTKAEKAENLSLSLSAAERLGLLSKAEEVGLDSEGLLCSHGPRHTRSYPRPEPRTAGSRASLRLPRALQVAVATICVLSGSATFAASNFVSSLQKSN